MGLRRRGTVRAVIPGGFSEAAGCFLREFAKLAAEMLRVAVSAELGDLADGLRRIYQLFLRQADASLDDILHTGSAEDLLVDQLQVART